ncbi:HpcH/HpaI aldolase/citrate lyase family protein, partial [Escherichia sp. HC-TM1]
YMPATREDIADAVLHGKIPGLRSLVICLEDAVSEADIPVALKNLEHLLHELSNSMRSLGKNDWPLVFIRPRHAEMGRWLKAHYDLSAVDGFVLPKFTLSSLAEWWDIMGGTHLC